MTDDASVREMREYIVTEVHQFASLVRAQIARGMEARASDDPDAGEHHTDAWLDIYGQVALEGQPDDDVAARAGSNVVVKHRLPPLWRAGWRSNCRNSPTSR